MARPKKIKEEPKIEESIVEPLTVNDPIPAPEPAPAPQPETPKFRPERMMEEGGVTAKRLPDVVGGVCEYCGPGRYDPMSSQSKMVEDWTVDPVTQIGRCEHYKGVQVRCSYCPAGANFADNIKHRKHVVHVSPFNPNELIIVCDDQACATKHINRFTK